VTGHPVRSAVRTVPWVGVGTAGLLGYGTLKANWALGGTWGVTDPARWRSDLAALTGPELLAAFWGTVVLDVAGLVLLVLLARAADRRRGAPRVLRVPAWTGAAVLGVAGVAGVLVTLAAPSQPGADPLASWVYLVVYGSFGLVALALGRLALLTRRRAAP
jgi:hypothetical protein